ncbi:MAG: hypothetical protein AB7S75_19090 [Desulfococcaceae bacterium]
MIRIIFILLFLLLPMDSYSIDISGDFNNDGFIDLKEAVFALQVVAGIRNQSSVCQKRFNNIYHESYFELCGTGGEPVSKDNDISLSLWAEVNSPFSGGGIVWFDDFYLISDDGSIKDIIPNPSFTQNFEGWKHLENTLCPAEIIWCGYITYINVPGLDWEIDNSVYYSKPCSVKVTVPKEGYQTHAFLYPSISMNNIPYGTRFKASALVKIEGDLQVRIGIDFTDSSGFIVRSVSGEVIQLNPQYETAKDWTLVKLR